MLGSLIISFGAPIVTDQEGRCPFGGISVIACDDVCVGLKKEADVGVPDALADHLGVHSRLQGACRVAVA
jgi:hypothetical protein